MQSAENKILSRIYGHGRGWAFFAKDFSAEFGTLNIEKALSELTKLGKIRRVCRGITECASWLRPDFLSFSNNRFFMKSNRDEARHLNS